MVIFTAQFVRMARSPFGFKAADVAVFAQHLDGGLTIFTNNHVGRSVRVRAEGLAMEPLLMTGFAVAEPRLPLEGPARDVAERLRAVTGEIELGAEDAATLAKAVGGLELTLVLTGFQGPFASKGPDLAFGDWSVMTQVVEADD